MAKIIPIYKKDSPLEPKNYRPISLIYPAYKLFERALHSQMIKFCNDQNIIFKDQHGFRKGRSTDTALNVLVENLNNYIGHNKFCPALFLDLSKAFDTVDLSILLTKLSHYGFSNEALSIIYALICKRKIYVKVNDSYSNMKDISIGVPQGSVLGPFFFLIYINDFYKCLHNSNLIHYADDTLLYSVHDEISTAIDTLKFDLNSAHEWFNANRLKLNIDKTQFIIFCSKNNFKTSNAKSRVLNFYNQAIKASSTVNYLGIILDANLTFNEHVSKVCRKVSQKLGSLSNIKFLLPMKVRKVIYSSLILPNLFYCINVWSHATASTLKRLTIVFNRICRNILLIKKRDMSTEQLYTELGWLNLHQQIEFELAVVAYKYIHNLISYEITYPPFIHEITPYPLRTNDNFRLPFNNNSFHRQTIMYRSSLIWNNLPGLVKGQNSLSSFKKHLKLFIQGK